MTRRTLVVVLVCVTVVLAGCAGWGTDGPANEDDTESDDADDLEEANADSEGDDSNTTDGDVADDTGDASGDDQSDGPDDESDSDESVSTTGESNDASADSDDSNEDGDSAPENESDDDSGDAPADGTDSNGSPAAETDADEDEQTNGVDEESSDDDGTNEEETSNDDNDSGESDTYTYSLTIEVFDENDDPVEGETVIEDHEAIEPVEHRTDANGEVLIEFQNSMPNDVVERQITVGNETRTVWIEAGEQSLGFVVETDGTSDDAEAETGDGESGAEVMVY